MPNLTIICPRQRYNAIRVIGTVAMSTIKKCEETPVNLVLKEFYELFEKMQLPKHREATEDFLQATAEGLNSEISTRKPRRKPTDKIRSLSNLYSPTPLLF